VAAAVVLGVGHQEPEALVGVMQAAEAAALWIGGAIRTSSTSRRGSEAKPYVHSLVGLYLGLLDSPRRPRLYYCSFNETHIVSRLADLLHGAAFLVPF